MRFSHGAQTSYIYFKRIFEKIAFHISFQILSPIGRRSNAILRIFCPLRGVKMIFFPFRISASCWISSFSYLGIFVPKDDIFSLHILCLLPEFLLTRNQQTFVHQSEEGGGYSDFHARLNPNTSYRF